MKEERLPGETWTQMVERLFSEKADRDETARRERDAESARNIREETMRERAAAPAWMQNDDAYVAGNQPQPIGEIILSIVIIIVVLFVMAKLIIANLNLYL